MDGDNDVYCIMLIAGILIDKTFGWHTGKSVLEKKFLYSAPLFSFSAERLAARS